MTATLDSVAARNRDKPERTAEQKLAEELVARAREQGVSLTGPDGLLKQPRGRSCPRPGDCGQCPQRGAPTEVWPPGAGGRGFVSPGLQAGFRAVCAVCSLMSVRG